MATQLDMTRYGFDEGMVELMRDVDAIMEVLVTSAIH